MESQSAFFKFYMFVPGGKRGDLFPTSVWQLSHNYLLPSPIPGSSLCEALLCLLSTYHFQINAFEQLWQPTRLHDVYPILKILLFAAWDELC